ncbi:MAG: extracellular solute-binding protein [Devosiaceae bacterium]|nr:extracellular solute-binding protein [Devosiaceae bacterium]
MKNIKRYISVTISALGILAVVAPTFAQENTVNIYSYRQPELIAPVLDGFTKQTGIKTKVLYLGKGVLERLKAEGVNSPADVILSVSVTRLIGMKEGGVTQAVTRDIIASNIPKAYRGSEGHWFGLTTRARVVFASKERVSQNSITYAELADPKWKGRICSRSGQNTYNIALISSIISNEGIDKATTWLTGVKANLARSPVGNDRAQVKGVYSGECDIAIGHTYYAGKMRTNEENPEQKDWEASVKILFPNNDGRGVHVDISGMAMAKYAPNSENALALMEFLASAKGQEIYAEQVFEYPVLSGSKLSEIVKSFGEMNPDNISLETIAQNAAEASKLVDRIAFDD